MNLRLRVIAALVGVTAIISSDGLAQNPPPPAQQAEPAVPAVPLTHEQLDQLVAPIALYDDPLLADVLTASTYPLEVVEAHRWLATPANAALKGDDLANALANEDWDPSVKALVPFPAVLALMDSHLDWTERLGEAFLAQQGDVMDAVQRLRKRAEAAGTLKSSPQESVANEGGDVEISPPPSEVIYVPTYDPWCAYGAWPYPVYGPYYFAPWAGYCGPDAYFIGWDAGLFLPWVYWDWGYFDWRNRRIGIYHDHYDQFHPDREPAGNVWSHDPSHRVGVPYRDPRNAQQYQPMQNSRQSFRGYEGGGGSGEFERASPPAFESYGAGGTVRTESERGATSRGSFGGASHGFGGGVRGGGGGGGGHPRP